MIYILDTNLLSLLDHDNEASAILQMRLAQVRPSQIVTTIISYEEQMRGWLAFTARAKKPEEQVRAYQALKNHYEAFRDIPLLDFDEASSQEFARLRENHRRLSTPDLKIASITLANRATLLTQNLRDFEPIAELIVEDWSR